MDISVAEAGVLVTVAGIGIGYMSHRLTARKYEADERERLRKELKEAEREAREEGARREQLVSLGEDMQHMKTVEIPRIAHLERIQEGNTVAIKGLAEAGRRTTEQIQALTVLEGKRSESIDRLIDHLIDQHTPLKGA